MSGHSKWSTIKRQKAVTDQRRSGIFTKLANAITVAAKQGGGDPDMNFKLRVAIDKAKAANMPNDNIERATKRGTGELDGATIEEIVYEAYGPGGVALIIETATDNKNRTAGAIKSILAKYQGNMGGSGSVLWMFDKRGVIRVARESITDAEAFELAAIEAGAEDIASEDEGYTIITKPASLEGVRTALEQSGTELASADVELVPQNTVTPDDSKKATLQKLLDELEENDDVSNYFTNADL